MTNIKNDTIIDKIEQSLEKIRPYLNNDGGDVVLVELTKKMDVKIKLTGSCKTCDVSMMTFKNGIESAIKKSVPQVRKVVDITVK